LRNAKGKEIGDWRTAVRCQKSEARKAGNFLYPVFFSGPKKSSIFNKKIKYGFVRLRRY
jgi:hypothetical protein